MSSCERQQQKPGRMMELDIDADGVAVLSAMDIPLDSQRRYTVGKCKICTVNSSDCGLIWADYPSSPREEKARLKARSKKKKCPAAQETEAADAANSLLASQMEQLGLPAGFGTSKGLCGEETDSGLEYSAEQDSKAGATSVHGDICSYPENVADQNGFAQQQGEASDWQQAYDHTYGCLYYYCERTQETQWEPPAAGFLPIPEEWLASPAQETASDAATPADVELQQTSHGTLASNDIPEPDKEPTQASPAVHLSIAPQHTTTDNQQAASNQGQGHHVFCDASSEPQQSRGQLILRPESSGLMSSIPEPQGTHVRFDSDTDAQQSCLAEDLYQDAEGSLAHQLGHVQLPDTHPEAFVSTAAQQAVQSIMCSTVATAEPIQQAAALSNIIPDGPLPTSTALQELAHAHDAAAVPGLAQGTLQQTRHDSDVEVAENKQEVAADADRPGITFQSLSNQLQSKRELPRKLWKYWLQRYSLFQRFDEGILMDEEGWYSATPEVIAAQQATKCRCSVIVDAFAGVGGNAIQFAQTCDRVIAVELSAQRLEIARHNAEVYGVADKIHFVCGDFLALAPTLQADIVFLSPPWGGPAYSKSGLFDVSQNIGSLGQTLCELLESASAALRQPERSNIACFLPRNTDLLALSDTVQLKHCVVERNVLNGHLKAVTAYYGDLANS